MRKGIVFFVVSLLIVLPSFGAVNFIPKRFNTITSHDDVYPYRLNNAKVKTNNNKKNTSTNTINSTSVAPIGKRGVIKQTTHARAATTPATSTPTPSERRVVPRGYKNVRAAQSVPVNRNIGERNSQNTIARSATPVRSRTNNARAASYNYSDSSNRISSQRCFADYKECMESYCKREDTPYNRCYCSAKLAQIDSKYQNKIDSLIQEIISLQYNTNATSAEIKDYWDKSIGTYTKTNPWVNIDNALNINWANMQSRVRGQNAFNTGHEYCVNNLRACSYMATNLRDAYKSEISRDCEAYERGLQKIQDAAESVIESYKN